jgi:rhodanese-related sulfurtransferase
MRAATKITCAALGCLGLGALALWWFADHRRGVAWAVSVVRDRFPDVTHLPPRSLAAWLADGPHPAPLLLDARSEEEFAVSHLAGAARLDPRADASALRVVAASERPIVVYCSAGYRSSQVSRRLREIGAKDVANLEGGIFAWANEGFEVVRNGEQVRAVHPYHSVFSRLLRRDLRPEQQ